MIDRVRVEPRRRGLFVSMHIAITLYLPLTQPITQPIGKAIIAQNKGGGHGELGYHLALKLIEKDISVTLLQDGAGKNKDKEPFARCASWCSCGAL